MPERGDAIVLIGFMGAGKSSIGRELAGRLAWPRYDTDEMVSERCRLSIAEIFAQRGEEKFREMEADAIERIPDERAIVVTGGGVVLRAENVQALRRLGTLVYLHADEATLFHRVSKNGTRPLLQTVDPRGTLTELLRLREPFYLEAADFSVDTSELRHAEVADAILEKLSGRDERSEV
jgi:shikimate kinase